MESIIKDHLRSHHPDPLIKYVLFFYVDILDYCPGHDFILDCPRCSGPVYMSEYRPIMLLRSREGDALSRVIDTGFLREVYPDSIRNPRQSTGSKVYWSVKGSDITIHIDSYSTEIKKKEDRHANVRVYNCLSDNIAISCINIQSMLEALTQGSSISSLRDSVPFDGRFVSRLEEAKKMSQYGLVVHMGVRPRVYSGLDAMLPRFKDY